jgi:translation initiation factor IF-3
LKQNQVKINNAIRARELRVIDGDGSNLGVIPFQQALDRAESLGLDLIEISPDANPPVAKIMDYGKFQYDQKKKQREIKSRTQSHEVKSIQIKIGTGENDMLLKAKRTAEWLLEGHRVKAELFLKGRSKYLESSFLEERLSKFLTLVATPHRIVDGFKKSPKGIMVTLEKNK